MTPLYPAELERYLRVGSSTSMASAVTRSHLPDGRCVGWYGPVPDGASIVIDAEFTDRTVPPALGRRFGHTDFWLRWTRAECAAKLRDVPILVWLARSGLEPGDGDVYVTVESASLGPDVMVTFGIAPRRS